jgi:hypothetical protein
MHNASIAIRFEPEGYTLEGPKLMGRQAAGNGFLRAAVAGLRGETLWAYTPHQRSAEIFAEMVASIDPKAASGWVPANRLDLLSRIGTLYLPDPSLAAAGRLRLRAGPAAYSLVGVTHTIASHAAMDAITGLLAGRASGRSRCERVGGAGSGGINDPVRRHQSGRNHFRRAFQRVAVFQICVPREHISTVHSFVA